MDILVFDKIIPDFLKTSLKAPTCGKHIIDEGMGSFD